MLNVIKVSDIDFLHKYLNFARHLAVKIITTACFSPRASIFFKRKIIIPLNGKNKKYLLTQNFQLRYGPSVVTLISVVANICKCA